MSDENLSVNIDVNLNLNDESVKKIENQIAKLTQGALTGSGSRYPTRPNRIDLQTNKYLEDNLKKINQKSDKLGLLVESLATKVGTTSSKMVKVLGDAGNRLFALQKRMQELGVALQIDPVNFQFGLRSTVTASSQAAALKRGNLPITGLLGPGSAESNALKTKVDAKLVEKYGVSLKELRVELDNIDAIRAEIASISQELKTTNPQKNLGASQALAERAAFLKQLLDQKLNEDNQLAQIYAQTLNVPAIPRFMGSWEADLNIEDTPEYKKQLAHFAAKFKKEALLQAKAMGSKDPIDFTDILERAHEAALQSIEESLSVRKITGSTDGAKLAISPTAFNKIVEQAIAEQAAENLAAGRTTKKGGVLALPATMQDSSPAFIKSVQDEIMREIKEIFNIPVEEFRHMLFQTFGVYLPPKNAIRGVSKNADDERANTLSIIQQARSGKEVFGLPPEVSNQLIQRVGEFIFSQRLANIAVSAGRAADRSAGRDYYGEIARGQDPAYQNREGEAWFQRRAMEAVVAGEARYGFHPGTFGAYAQKYAGPGGQMLGIGSTGEETSVQILDIITSLKTLRTEYLQDGAILNGIVAGLQDMSDPIEDLLTGAIQMTKDEAAMLRRILHIAGSGPVAAYDTPKINQQMAAFERFNFLQSSRQNLVVEETQQQAITQAAPQVVIPEQVKQLAITAGTVMLALPAGSTPIQTQGSSPIALPQRINGAIPMSGGASPNVVQSVDDSINSIYEERLALFDKLIGGPDREAYYIKKIGLETFKKFRENFAKMASEMGDQLAIGFDTEFISNGNYLGPALYEASMVMKNMNRASAPQQIYGMMHQPPYQAPGYEIGKQNIAFKDTPVKSISGLHRQAGLLNIPLSQLGSTTDVVANASLYVEKVDALIGILELARNVDIPVIGNNLNAELNSLFHAVAWLNVVGASVPDLNVPALPLDLTNMRDVLEIIKGTGSVTNKNKIAGLIDSQNVNDPGVALVKELSGGGGGLGLGNILKALLDVNRPWAKEIPDSIRSLVSFGEKGGFDITMGDKKFNAHTAQADAAASLLVSQIFAHISPEYAALFAERVKREFYTADFQQKKGGAVKFGMDQRIADANAVVAYQQQVNSVRPASGGAGGAGGNSGNNGPVAGDAAFGGGGRAGKNQKKSNLPYYVAQTSTAAAELFAELSLLQGQLNKSEQELVSMRQKGEAIASRLVVESKIGNLVQKIDDQIDAFKKVKNLSEDNIKELRQLEILRAKIVEINAGSTELQNYKDIYSIMQKLKPLQEAYLADQERKQAKDRAQLVPDSMHAYPISTDYALQYGATPYSSTVRNPNTYGRGPSTYGFNPGPLMEGPLTAAGGFLGRGGGSRIFGEAYGFSPGQVMEGPLTAAGGFLGRGGGTRIFGEVISSAQGTWQEAGKVFTAEIKRQMTEYVDKTKEVEKQNKSLLNSWVTGRYALYDVGNAYQNVSNRMFALMRQIFSLTSSVRSYETAFVSVSRSMQLQSDEILGVKNAFVELSQEIPVTFEDLSRIATLGAQMGVGASGILDFTKVVAQFSTITGISAETVSQQFGRISQLAKVDPSQYSNLGSAIAYAGVNAVATETEIMNLSEAIAAVSSNAGFSGSEIVGYATALASLGVPAEQSRGVFTRVFADIDRAVNTGGSKLTAFAKIAGMSSKDFAAAWADPNGGASRAFASMLSGISTSKNMTKTFDDLGIVETREINTLTRLASNMDVVTAALDNSSSAYAENLFLQQAFDQTAKTLDSRIKIFQNTIKSAAEDLAASWGFGLSVVTDAATGLAKVLSELAKNPFLSGVLGLGVAGVGIGGLGAGAVALLSKMTAQIYAFRVAQVNAANDPAVVSGYGKQIAALLNYKTELIEIRSGLRPGDVTSRGQIQPISYVGSGAKNTQDKNAYLLAEANTYRASGDVILQIQNEIAESEGRLNDVKKMSSLSAQKQLELSRQEASQLLIAQEVRRGEIFQYEQMIGAIDQEITAKLSNGQITAEQAALMRLENAALLDVARSRQIHMAAIDGEYKALGLDVEMKALDVNISDKVVNVTRQEAAARIAAAEAANLQATGVAAVNTETNIASGIQKNAFSSIGSKLIGVAGWIGVAVTAVTTIGMIVEGITNAVNEANNFNILESGGGLASLRDAIKQDTEEYNKTGKALSVVQVETKKYSSQVNAAATQIQKFTGVKVFSNLATTASVSKIKSETVAIGENTKAWIANSISNSENIKNLLNEYPSFFSDIESMGIDLKKILEDALNPNVKNPTSSIDSQIEAMRKRANALYDEMYQLSQRDVSLGENNQQGGYFKSLQREYKQLNENIPRIEKYREVIDQIAKATKEGVQRAQLSDIIFQLFGIEDAAGDAGNAVDKVSKSLKSLGDWASEVGTVMQNAFNQRFGKIQALDAITTGWNSVKKATEDANKAIEDANTTISKLGADRSKLEKWLTVARKYGDTKRIQALEAQLAENDQQLSSAQQQLSDAKAKSDKTLVGDSETAIGNRSTLYGIMGDYRNLAVAVLSTEPNAKKANKQIEALKEQFRQNAIAMGFNVDEINDNMIPAFEDMIKIAKSLPRNYNMTFDPDPALNAIEEFVKKANELLGGIKPPKIDPPKIDPLVVTVDVAESLLKQRNGFPKNSSMWDYFNKLYKDATAGSGGSAGLKYLFRASGGLVTGPGSGTSDSIPAMLSNGEYVISAAASRQYGLPFLNALNQQRVGYSPVQPNVQQISTNDTQMVYLSPDDRALLRAAIDRPINLYTENRKIAQSANAGNVELARRGVN